MTRIGVVAPGAMGSAVARRLAGHGATVLTLLEGRSAATRDRAEAAGMVGTDEAGLAEADLLLSIVPPAEAMALAVRMKPALRAAARPALYVDCNALDVRTVQAVGSVIGPRFVDAAIIGLPPRPGTPGPTFYFAGDDAPAVVAVLSPLGLVARAMDGGIGAASALKMGYAGITKGLAALASIMILGAERAGAGPALRAELAASQPQLLARFESSLPTCCRKPIAGWRRCRRSRPFSVTTAQAPWSMRGSPPSTSASPPMWPGPRPRQARFWPSSKKPLLPEAEPPAVADDHVVVQHHAEHLGRVPDDPRHLDIGRRRRWVAAGVVVDQDQRRRMQLQRALHDLPRIHRVWFTVPRPCASSASRRFRASRNRMRNTSVRSRLSTAPR